MSTPYIGEIRMVGFSFAPPGWLACNGQVLQISQYDVLFNLIGTTYGGDGQSTFALPNLQSRVAINQGSDGSGNSYTLGTAAGAETVTLTANTLGSHMHPFAASNANGSTGSPAGAYPAATNGFILYASDSTNNVAAFAGNGIAMTGTGGPHNNIMPYQCISFIIATDGIYPTPN